MAASGLDDRLSALGQYYEAVVIADCHAEWIDDVATRQRICSCTAKRRLHRLRITDVDTLSGRKAPLTWP